jgi:hypothetical protein
MHDKISRPKNGRYYCLHCGRTFHMPNLSEIKHPAGQAGTDSIWAQALRATEYLGLWLGGRLVGVLAQKGDVTAVHGERRAPQP